jgi:hypothetical protein
MVFYNTTDNEKQVSISIGLHCNHDIPKHMITNIENYVSGLFFGDYITEDSFKQKKLELKQNKMKKKLDDVEKYKMSIGK